MESNDWILTAYCTCQWCCNNSNGISASGKLLTEADEGKVCSAPTSYPFFSVLQISGEWEGIVTVVDRDCRRDDKRLDIFMSTHEKAVSFGFKADCSVTLIKQECN